MTQITADELDRMTPAQINEARKAGRLDTLMRNPPEQRRTDAPAGQLTETELTTMTTQQINEARRDGKLNWLLGRTR